MTPLSGLQQTTKADGPTTAPTGAKAFPWLAYLKIMLAGGDLNGAERCHFASPTLATAGQSPCF